jgi:hypothetical protein
MSICPGYESQMCRCVHRSRLVVARLGTLWAHRGWPLRELQRSTCRVHDRSTRPIARFSCDPGDGLSGSDTELRLHDSCYTLCVTEILLHESCNRSSGGSITQCGTFNRGASGDARPATTSRFRPIPMSGETRTCRPVAARRNRTREPLGYEPTGRRLQSPRGSQTYRSR